MGTGVELRRRVERTLPALHVMGIAFVVKDHALLERGTHHELLASGEFYAELHDIQFHTDQPDAVFA
jgi:hypothetical protein